MTVLNAYFRRQRNKLPQRLDIEDSDSWQGVLRAPEIFTFLEFDGTLVEIAPQPADVVLNERRKRHLRELLSAPGCSVAVVSGRPTDELRKLIGIDGIFYVGCHGLEWTLPDGTRYVSWPQKMVVDALQALREQLRDSLGALTGILLEYKTLALALHYREAKRQTALTARKEFARAVHWYQQQGVKLELVAGKKVIEAKAVGAKKGDAIAQILGRRSPTAFPIYIGDDLADESAFDTVAKKGLAILVAKTPCATAAAFHLRNPGEVYAYVRRLNQMRRTSSEPATVKAAAIRSSVKRRPRLY
jgi:trehalose-phosphatase